MTMLYVFIKTRISARMDKKKKHERTVMGKANKDYFLYSGK